MRQCSATGLSPCSVAKPGPESCNGKDDDCNGKIDDGATEAKTLCDDGNACLVGEACVSGACKAGQPLACDDDNACTDDACNKASGCTHAANTGPCEDGNPCSQGDTCKDKACAGTGAKDCNDNNPCTVDGCDAVGTCSHVANDGPPCLPEGGNVCSSGGSCVGGACKPGPAKGCDDGNPCTDDSCDPKAGCVAKPNSAVCDDGNPCTQGDKCNASACQAGTNACECQNDADCALKPGGNPCLGKLVCDKSGAKPACVMKAGTAIDCPSTLDTLCSVNTCDPASGACKLAPVNAGKGCDDGSACTNGDSCSDGSCKPGTATNCDDANPCTVDTCDAKAGCKHAPGAGVCEDGNPCTLGDTCGGGACVPGTAKVCEDGNGCTSDTCDVKTGSCTADGTPLNGKACASSQGECAGAGSCAAGTCKAGAAVNCDDSNACTTDSCTPAGGCQHAAASVACTDGNPCTEDSCQNGKCTGKAKVCDDNFTCTADSCDANGACVYAPIANCVSHSQTALGGAYNDQFWAVRGLADGGMIAAGETLSWGAGSGDGLAVRTNACGKPIWTRTFGGTGKEYFNDVKATADGGFLLAGATYSTDIDGDIFVVKVDGNGATQWVWTGGGTGLDFAKSVAVTADGGCVVAGKTYSFGPNTPALHNAIVVKLDASGAQAWSRIYGAPKDTGSMDISSIAEVKDKSGVLNGFLAIGGSEGFGSGKDDIWLMRLAPDGTHSWSVVYGGSGDDDPQSGFVQTADLGFVLGFWETGFGAKQSDAGLLKVDADGKLLWMKRYAGSGKTEPYGLALVGSDLVLTGFTNSWTAGGIDAFVLRVTGSGELVSLRTLGGSVDEMSQGIAIMADGGLGLAGRTSSNGKGGFDAWIARTGVDGASGCQDLGFTNVVVSAVTPVTSSFTPVLLTAGATTVNATQSAVVETGGAVTVICACK